MASQSKRDVPGGLLLLATGLLTLLAALFALQRAFVAAYRLDEYLGISSGRPDVAALKDYLGATDAWGLLLVGLLLAALGQFIVGILRIVRR